MCIKKKETGFCLSLINVRLSSPKQSCWVYTDEHVEGIPDESQTSNAPHFNANELRCTSQTWHEGIKTFFESNISPSRLSQIYCPLTLATVATWIFSGDSGLTASSFIACLKLCSYWSWQENREFLSSYYHYICVNIQRKKKSLKGWEIYKIWLTIKYN